MVQTQVPTYYVNEEDSDEEIDAGIEEQKNSDKPAYSYGSNEVVKILNQKSVICVENLSVYATRQCGHQCILKVVIKSKVMWI